MSKDTRPLSPHLQVYKWRVAMLTSILHRVTGTALAAGTVGLVLWLVALATGADAYSAVMAYLRHPIGAFVLFGMTWALLQHMASGVRHLIMDTGALYDLRVNRLSALLTYGFSVVATVVIWAYGYGLIGAGT